MALYCNSIVREVVRPVSECARGKGLGVPAGVSADFSGIPLAIFSPDGKCPIQAYGRSPLTMASFSPSPALWKIFSRISHTAGNTRNR